MEFLKERADTLHGPSDWFTGDVYLDLIAAPSGSSRVLASNVHFTPGARCHWHTHPNGQHIWITEGVGYCQRQGGPIEILRPGDRVYFEPGEKHWHGATATRAMSHIAIMDVGDDGANTDWGTPVSDDEHGAAPDVEPIGGS